MDPESGASTLLSYVNDLLDSPDTAALDVDALPPEMRELGARILFLGKCVEGGRKFAEELSEGNLAAMSDEGYDHDNPLLPSLETIRSNLARSLGHAQQIMQGEDVDMSGGSDYATALENVVEELRSQQDTLIKTAFTDALTGLGNRGGYLRSLDELWEAGKPVTMAFIDIDNLKHMNDAYGHDAGNRYILQVSLSLKLYAQVDEALYRIGGDEFVLLSTCATEDELNERLEHCRSVLIKNNSADEMVHSFSYGVSSANPAQGDTPQRMANDADRRMYTYKLSHSKHLSRQTMGADPDYAQLNESIFQALSLLNEGRYLFINNIDTGSTRWSIGAVRDLGIPAQHVKNSFEMWKQKVHPDDYRAYYDETQKILSGETHSLSMQYRVRDASDEYVLCNVRGYRIDATETSPAVYVGEIVNHSLAETIDYATGLGTQNALVNALTAAKRSGRATGVVEVRVHGIARINDAYGYEVGDRVLADLAGRLVSYARGQGRVFRSRNAQFVIVAEGVGRDEFHSFACMLDVILQAPITIHGETFTPDLATACIHYDRLTSRPFPVIAELDRRVNLNDALNKVETTQSAIPANVKLSLDSEHIDSLTGLYRSGEFMRRASLFKHSHDARQWCIVTVDMGHMRLYNEWYGLDQGNCLLAEVGSYLKDLETEDRAIAGYWGQDDFCLLCPFDRPLLDEIYRCIKQTVAAHDDSVGFLPSMGVCPVDEDEDITIDHQAKAMFANRRAKTDFKNRIALFNPADYQREINEHKVLTEFQYALSGDRITFYVQPQVDIATGKIIGAEALTRWIDEDGSLIPPARFIPALERSGFVGTLDKYIWNDVFKWLAGLIEAGVDVVPISINVSRVDVVTFDVAGYIERLARHCNLPRDLVKIEITETAYAKEVEQVGELAKTLREYGFSTYMDDFGSGQSSLSMLKNVNLDVMKLDRCFVPDENDDEKSEQIMGSMLDMARSLDLPVVVEGIETEKQAELTLKMGGRYAQGYYFYKPMPRDEFEQLLADPDKVDHEGVRFE